MLMEEAIQSFQKNTTAGCGEQSSSSTEKLVDPLTGKRIELIWQNGFSSFKEKTGNGTCNTEETKTWKVHQKSSKESLCHYQEAGNAIGMRYVSEGKRRLLEVANFKGEAKQNKFSGILRELYQNWKNPVFGVSKERQLETQVDLSVNSKHRKLVQLGTASFTFCKESLENIDMIGQVDDKFIACTVSIDDEGKKGTRLLLLVDQHAAHERIRLEALQDEFLQGIQKNEKGFSVNCKDLIPPLNVELSVPFDCSMRKLKSVFERIGIRYIVKSENVVEEKCYVELVLVAMPALFIDSSGNSGNKSILEESTIKDLFHSHIKQHQVTPLPTSLIPPSINNVLCSYACHGAIKFGDALTAMECSAIIKSLARCRLPFQCAHGRPSIAPLIKLDKVS